MLKHLDFLSALHPGAGLAQTPSFEAFSTETQGPLAAGDDIPADASTTHTLVVDGPSDSSSIDSSGDHDWFAVDLVAGESYAFAVNGITLSDPFLNVYNSAGTLVSLDDDGGPGSNSLMHFTAVESGTYYLSAQGFESATGSYTISAAHGPPQNPLDTLDLGFTFDTHTIAVYFATSGQHFPPSGTASRSWTAAEQSAVMSALATISASTNVTFTTTTNSAAADFTFTLDTLGDNVLGQTFPGSTHAYLEFDPNEVGWDSAGLMPGGLGYSVIIHEVGHALGLDHPFDDGLDNQVMQGVVATFNSYGTFLMNQQVFTIMSYNDGWPMGPNGPTPSYNFGYAQSMMALDVAALQQRYGVNPTTNNGATNYVLGDSTTAGGYTAIWDTGGTDAITYSGARNATIDLHAATLLSEIGGGGVVSFVSGVYGGYTIANGVVIENATGGSGSDSITGNDASNVLTGNAGSDSLMGGAGDDTLVGGSGANFLDGGDGSDTASFAGATFVSANLQTGAVSGGNILVSIENLIGSSVNDTLTGSAGVNALSGGDGDDILAGGAGADALDGGNGVDTADYSASTAAVSISLSSGTGSGGDAEGDTLTAIENLTGSAFDDSLTGDANANALSGGNGDDVLAGRSGGDVLNGGAGINTADYSASGAGVTVNLTAASASGGDAAGDALTNIQNLTGSNFGDGLTGDAGANALSGGGGNDTLAGRAGADALDGGASDDTADYSASSAGVTVDLAAGTGSGGDAQGDSLTSIENIVGSALGDVLTGNDTGNVLTGGDGADTLSGGLGGDQLIGGNGDDMLIGGAGADVLGGGAGVDTADYSTSSAAVTVNLQTALGSGGDAQGDAYASIENITGSAFDDVLTGRNGFANVLDGSDGNDLIAGGQGADTLIGGNGVDTLDYSNSFNGVDIRLFQNTAAGGDANGDSISGFENIIGSTKTDTLAGDDGVNVISGGSGNETITGRDGGDHLNGDAGNDTLLGGNGDDVLIGGAGNDTLGGGTGNDTADYSASAAAINVSLQAGTGSGGDAQGDTLVSIENVIGSAFADIIAGKNNWDNVLDGGAGADTLSGGTGNDTFVFHANDANGDTVLDFSHTGAGNHDTLEFDGYGLAVDGATFVQIDATHWQINSADGLIHDTLIIANAVVLTSGDYIFGGG